VTIKRWYNSFSPTDTGRKVLEDGCQDGLRDTLLRGPKAAVQQTESRHTATLGSFLGLLGFRCECGQCAGRLLRRRLCENVLRYLIAILNRNTLVPSAARSTERGRYIGSCAKQLQLQASFVSPRERARGVRVLVIPCTSYSSLVCPAMHRNRNRHANRPLSPFRWIAQLGSVATGAALPRPTK